MQELAYFNVKFDDQLVTMQQGSGGFIWFYEDIFGVDPPVFSLLRKN